MTNRVLHTTTLFVISIPRSLLPPMEKFTGLTHSGSHKLLWEMGKITVKSLAKAQQWWITYKGLEMVDTIGR